MRDLNMAHDIHGPQRPGGFSDVQDQTFSCRGDRYQCHFRQGRDYSTHSPRATVAVAKGESEIPQRMCDQISPLFANMGASRSRPISVTTSKVVCETFIGPDKARVTTNITKINSH